MKERLTGFSLAVGATLTLGMIWADSAQAFLLDQKVMVTNFLGLEPEPFQGPTDATVGSGIELTQFGGIWDIDLGEKSISFTLNSLFGDVRSGEDIYQFLAPDFGQPGQKSVIGFKVTPLKGSLAFSKEPVVELLAGNRIDVVFPLKFAPGNPPDLTLIPGQLGFKIDLTVEPILIPTPALLPGLVGIGLAAWRNRRGGGDQYDGRT